MSQYLEHLPLGSTIDFRGPSGLLTYEGKGARCARVSTRECAGSFRTLTKKTDLNSARIVRARRLGMIAGGTGITPMYQLIKHILVHEPNNADTQMWLLYANQSVDDILLREELDALAAAHPRRLRVWYTVDRAPAAGTQDVRARIRLCV
jgi:ferredoxin-NADP reductase